MLLIAVAFAALARNSGRILLGGLDGGDAPAIAVPPTVAAALLLGVAASIALGITAGPLTDLFTAAAASVGAIAVSRNWLRHRLSQGELGRNGRRPAGQRVSSGPGGGARRRTIGFRVVYLFLAGWPDRRVELECVVPKDDPMVRSLAYLSFTAGRFEREMADLYGIRPDRASQAAPPGAPRTLARDVVSDAQQRRARTRIRKRPAISRSSPSRDPGCMRSRSARCTPG